MSFNTNYFLHAANVLLLVAYCVRDILWLRLFALASALIAIPYFALQPTPLWAPISWSTFFAAVNAFQTWRLFIERRPVKLTTEEEYVRHLIFQGLPTRKVLQVLSVGSWSNIAPGQCLLERGKVAQTLSLVVSGRVRVLRNGAALGDLSSGDIVGSALLLSGSPAEVDAVAMEPVRAVCWDTATLQRYLAANPETRILMQRYLARDLAIKFVGALVPNVRN